MDPNSQRPESIPPAIGPRGFFTGIEIRPIITGVVVDYVATMIAFVIYLTTYLPRELVEKGNFSEEAVNEALKEMMTSQEGLLSLAVIGAAGTALGGYVAGRMAKAEKVKHGALVGLVSLIVGILITGGPGEGSLFPYWYEVLTYVLPIPAGALGGLFAGREW